MVADGQPNGGDGSRRRCRRLEDLAGKDASVLALAGRSTTIHVEVKDAILHKQWGDLRCTDGGGGGCRQIEDLARKDAGSFALADGD